MKPPIFVRPLTAAERQQVQAGRRSADPFTGRRCPILLARANGWRPPPIARHLGWAVRTVHSARPAFPRQGLACLKEKSARPPSARPFLDDPSTEPLTELLHPSPPTFGKPTSLGTRELVAEVCPAQAWTPRQLTGEAIHGARQRLGIRCRRATYWITSPDPASTRKKKRATG